MAATFNELQQITDKLQADCNVAPMYIARTPMKAIRFHN